MGEDSQSEDRLVRGVFLGLAAVLAATVVGSCASRGTPLEVRPPVVRVELLQRGVQAEQSATLRHASRRAVEYVDPKVVPATAVPKAEPVAYAEKCGDRILVRTRGNQPHLWLFDSNWHRLGGGPLFVAEGDGIALAGTAWGRERVIFSYETGIDIISVVLSIDLSKGALRTLLREPKPQGAGPIRDGVLSPDGSLFAFSRQYGGTVIQGRRCGVGLLAIRSGRYAEVTFERGGDYGHQALAWDGNNTFLFERRVQTGRRARWDLYRAYVHDGVRRDAASAVAGKGTQRERE